MARARAQVIGQTRGWIEPAARIGYVAKGVVFVLIGALAVLAATGSGGRLGGGETAVRTIGQQPFGQLLLVVTAIGLFAYALWRAISALLDPEHHGTEPKGIAIRVALGVSALVYTALGILAMQLAMGGGGGGRSERSYAASVLAWDGGAFIIAIAAVALLVYAAHQLHESWTSDFAAKLRTEEMSENERTWAVRIGRAGIAARAVVFIVVGVGLARAALTGDASRVRGVGGALAAIAAQPFGVLLLLFVALGLVAYGLHQFVEARYRRIPAR